MADSRHESLCIHMENWRVGIGYTPDLQDVNPFFLGCR